MNKQLSIKWTVLITCLVVLGSSVVFVSGQEITSSTIEIDGNLTDWNNITPILDESEVNQSYAMDLQRAYIINNDTHLFFRFDYSNPYQSMQTIFGNVTIETPNGSVYILSSQIVFDGTPHSVNMGVFEGRSLNSPYNAWPCYYVLYPEDSNHTAAAAVDLTTNTSYEVAFPLADINLDVQQQPAINLTFWHWDNIPATSVLQPATLACITGSVYRRYPQEGVVRYTVSSNNIVSSERSTNSEQSKSEEQKIPFTSHYVLVISFFVLVILNKRLR